MENNDLFENNRVKELYLKYGFAKEKLETEIKILLEEYEYTENYNPVEHIKSRIKSFDSVIKKLIRKNYELTPENIENHVHDMIGMRIVCSFLSDCRNVVKLIKDSNLFQIKEEKDYISNPKDSGYLSYHLIVLVPIRFMNNTEYIEAEIQIRTLAMDFWASLDHKLRYKIDKKIPNNIIEEIYYISQDINNLDEKMEKMRAKISNISKQNNN